MARSNSIDRNVHHVEKGVGPTVVLIHGFPLDSRMWDEQLNVLSERYRVIAIDMPGFGESKSDEPFTIDDQADAVHSHLKKIGAVPCVLAGLSMGGYVALAFVQKYPTDLKGLALIDTKAAGDTPEQKTGRMKMIDLVREKGSTAVADAMLPKLVAETTLKSRPLVVSKLREIMEACPPKTIERALLAMRDREDRSCNLPSIPMPVAIIVGESDAITPVSIAQDMKKAISHAGLVVVKDSGHMSPMEQPEQVNAALGNFLQRCYG